MVWVSARKLAASRMRRNRRGMMFRDPFISLVEAYCRRFKYLSGTYMYRNGTANGSRELRRSTPVSMYSTEINERDPECRLCPIDEIKSPCNLRLWRLFVVGLIRPSARRERREKKIAHLSFLRGTTPTKSPLHTFPLINNNHHHHHPRYLFHP